MNKILKIYTNAEKPGAFGGAARFVQNNNQFKINDVNNELIKHDFYTLHKPIIKKFKNY